jgi:hypothetical protein
MNTIATTPTVTPSTPNPKVPQPQPKQRQTAKEMIAANLKGLIEQLEAGRSDALTAYLDAMSRFHNYSFGNVLEIARQRPSATHVAGMYAWNQLGRRVKKGEKGTQSTGDDAKRKAEQDKQRRDEAIANTTGIRVLAAIGDAVPVRLMKRDLLVVVERLAGMMDENRLSIVAKQHGIKKAKDSDSIAKLFAAFLRRAEEGVLGRLMVELTIVFAASRGNAPAVLKDAAAVYKVDTDAIAAKVKQEFAAKEKAKAEKKLVTKAPSAKLKKTA